LLIIALWLLTTHLSLLTTHYSPFTKVLTEKDQFCLLQQDCPFYPMDICFINFNYD
jgi:hypothetical protein